MSRRRPITLRRPEGGAEHTVSFTVNHGCSAARLYKQEAGFDDVDEVVMPVGLFGYEMPSGVPFEVVSANPCEACNTFLRAEFMWSGPKVFLP